jgi:undecaprenyl diphosphate synthase
LAKPKKPKSWKGDVAPQPAENLTIRERYPEVTRVPYHVGIIMDGNGRWARARGLPRVAGHKAGTDNLRRVLRACVEFGVKVLTVYAFSTENWARPPDEVAGLMSILGQAIRRETHDLHANGVRILHSGRLEGVAPRLAQQIQDAIALTINNSRITLNVAFNYGGRAEIVDAIKHILRDGLQPADVTENLISDYLYNAGLPDPDLIIRTGGEWRLSNFLIWQAAYAEYYATPTFWPDFDEAELAGALIEYSQRERRFGKVPEPDA